MSAKQQGAKDVGVVTALRAFEAMYKAACRNHGTLPHKPVLKTLRQAQENSQSCNKIVLSGSSVDAAVCTAVVECLASYTAVKCVCCCGCSIGDEGIIAIAHLLRASSGKWWRGCRLNALELCADGRALPPQPAPAPAAMTAQQASRATAGLNAQPAPATGSPEEADAEKNSPSATGAAGAVRMTTASATAATIFSANTAGPRQKPLISGRQDTTMAAAASRSTPCQDAMNAGVCPAHLQLRFHQAGHLQPAQQSLWEKCGPPEGVRYRGQPPRPMVQVSKWVLDATLDPQWHGCKQQQRQETQHGVRQHIDSAAVSSSLPESKTQQRSQWGPAEGPAVQLEDPLQQQEQWDLVQKQTAMTATMGTDPISRFSAHALQELSLGLGVSGLSLRRLVLDHTLIGDAGISTLAAGLSRCCSLKHLSVCYCGIGPVGIRDMAAACALLNTDSASNTSSCTAAASRLSIGISNSLIENTNQTSGALDLEELLLNGNPLGAAGLQHLSTALRFMSSLRVLGLAEICVSDVDKVQLQGLVYALTVGPTHLEQLDFDANYIGDRAASHFLTLLPGKPSLLMLKLTARLSPEIVTKLTELLQQNLRTAQPRARK